MTPRTKATGGQRRDGAGQSGASAQDEPAPTEFTFRKPSEILGQTFSDSDKILGERLLAENQALTICGQGGIGKSRLVLQLAACQILLVDFIGMKTHGPPRKWLILQTENNNRRLQFDLAKLKQWAGGRWPEIDDKLLLHTLETDDDWLVNFERSESRIRAAISKYQPDIVVFDPLNAFTLGDLNADADMLRVCLKLAEMVKQGNPKRALIVLHHALTGRAGASKATGYDRSSFNRNSKALLNWTRAQINLAPGSEDDNETLVVSCGKNSNGPEFKSFAVRMNRETMIYEPFRGFDFDGWKNAIAGKAKRKCTTEEIAELVSSEGDTKAGVARKAEEKTGISRATGNRIISEAIRKELIRFDATAKKCFPVAK